MKLNEAQVHAKCTTIRRWLNRRADPPGWRMCDPAQTIFREAHDERRTNRQALEDWLSESKREYWMSDNSIHITGIMCDPVRRALEDLTEDIRTGDSAYDFDVAVIAAITLPDWLDCM